VSRGTHLVEHRDHLGCEVSTSTAFRTWRRDEFQDVREARPSAVVHLPQPVKMRRQYQQVVRLVPRDVVVAGAPFGANSTDLANVMQKVPEADQLGGHCVPRWRTGNDCGHGVQVLEAMPQQAPDLVVMVVSARATANEQWADARVEQDAREELTQRRP
jgi:hypothetical protein